VQLLDGHTPKPVPAVGDDLPRWRSVGAERVLASVEPLYAEVGITRVANVTGLDIIGIPVWQAIRPNSRGLAVSQGKGLTDALAKVSAVMESIESWHAERAELPCRIESFAGLAPTGRVIDPVALNRDINGTYNPFAPIPFCAATDLRTNDQWWVPFELVHANMVVPFVAGSGMFARNTNGLASGATLVEAVLHGLCEVIERDSHAVWNLGTSALATETRIDPDAIVDPSSASLIERFRDAHLDILLWDLTSDVGIPCVRAAVWDRQADLDLNPAAASGGFGCHPDPRIAMTRALTEAAQSRLTVISGARDDLTRKRHGAVRRTEVYDFWNEVAADRTPCTWAYAVPATTTVEADLEAILERMSRVGLTQVLVLDLSRADWPINVARVLVPGSEGPHSTPAYTPGRRAAAARTRLAEQQAVGA